MSAPPTRARRWAPPPPTPAGSGHTTPDSSRAVSGRPLPVVLVVAAGLVLVIGFVWTMLVGSYAQFAALLIVMVLVLITIPLARHAARIEMWQPMAWVVMGGMLLRLAGGLARYLVAYGLYGGVADASTYTQVATNNYRAFRQFHFFAPDTGVFHGLVPWLDTALYAIAGPTELGAFFVFAWINLIGTYLFYRAFRIAFPNGDRRRYALLVFFLPSLLYWPSSLGKEAWMVLAIGLASYGLARALAARIGGYLALLAGIGAMLLVRPHLALIFLPAAVIAFLLRRSAPGRFRPLGRLVGITVLVVSSLVVVAKAQSYFGITNLDVQSVTQQLKTTRQQTAEGNSAFIPPNAQSPLGYPQAVITVLFRPFPWEAHSLAVRVASLEGLIMLGLTAASWRRLRRLPRTLWRNPYVVFALVYSALFILAFANFSNFGILARERVQMLPLFMVLLAVPPGETALGQTRSKGRDGELGRGARSFAAPAPGIAPALDGRTRSSRSAVPPAPRLRQYGTPRRTPAQGYRGRTAVVARRRPLAAGSYRAFDFGFDVEVVAGTGAAELREQVLWTLGDLAAGAFGGHCYRLTLDAGGQQDRLVVERDGEVIGEAATAIDALVRVVSDVNIRAAASRPNQLVLHAAAVSLDGSGVVLPGPSGAGKTMLAAALVANGFAYLTDEAAAIELETFEIEPYPKPLSLRRDAWEILGLPATSRVGLGPEELVPSSVLRSAGVGSRVAVRMLLFPRYERGATTALIPMMRAEALVELANNSFNFVDHGAEWMTPLRRMVMQCKCHRLITGDLDIAAALVRRMIASDRRPDDG